MPAMTWAQNVRLPELPAHRYDADLSQLDSGFWCTVQSLSGFSFRGADERAFTEQLSVVAGYRFSEYLRLGAGIGGKKYFNGSAAFRTPESNLPGNIFLPVFLDVRGSILSQASYRMYVPYWSFDCGYSVGEGSFFNPALGVRFGGLRNDLTLAFSYLLQQSPFGSAHLVGLSIGYEF